MSLVDPIEPKEAVAEYIAAATKKAWVVEGLPADTPLKPVKKVGIIGAGTMGGGISMNFVNVGIPVHIVETKQEALDRGPASSRRTMSVRLRAGGSRWRKCRSAWRGLPRR